MLYTIRIRLAVVLLSSGSLLWAGREFHPRFDEELVPNEFVIQLKPGVRPIDVLPASLTGAVTAALRGSNLHLIKVPPGTPASVISSLAAHGLVDFLEPNHIRRTNLQPPNDSLLSSQWALTTVQAVQAWGIIPNQYFTAAQAGTGRMKVAVVDTGVDCTHPDFINSGGSSADSAAGGQLLFSSSQALVATQKASPACSWQDDHGHGTHVAGIVAAATQNTAGVAGLGYPLQVIAYKVLDSSGSGSDANVGNAIMAAADAGARVISLSLGGAGYSQTLQAAVNYAWQRNALVVAAMGNSGSNGLIFPGGANFAVGVAATDGSNARASFSTFGNATAIAAPGVSILSTLPTYTNSFGVTNYGNLSGTSMATPHVSALAGLLALSTPGVSASAILQRIQRSASSTVPNGGWDQYIGYGVINAYNALAGNFRSATIGALVGQLTDPSAVPLSGTVTVNGQTASESPKRIRSKYCTYDQDSNNFNFQGNVEAQ